MTLPTHWNRSKLPETPTDDVVHIIVHEYMFYEGSSLSHRTLAHPSPLCVLAYKLAFSSVVIDGLTKYDAIRLTQPGQSRCVMCMSRKQALS